MPLDVRHKLLFKMDFLNFTVIFSSILSCKYLSTMGLGLIIKHIMSFQTFVSSYCSKFNVSFFFNYQILGKIHEKFQRDKRFVTLKNEHFIAVREKSLLMHLKWKVIFWDTNIFFNTFIAFNLWKHLLPDEFSGGN